MSFVLLVLSLLMVIGAGLVLIAVVGMWGDRAKPEAETTDRSR